MNPAPASSLPSRALKVFLPREHGGWSLALEPLALGLIAAPSRAGAALGIAVLSGFFLRRPLKLLLGGEPDPRRGLAAGCAASFAGLGTAGLALAVAWSAPVRLWPLLLALPSGAAFLWFDSRNEAREEAAELAGVSAFAVVPAAVAAVAGWTAVPALALAAVMACRSVPTVMTVRAFLRRTKGASVSAVPALVASVLAVGAGVLLARDGLAPWFAVVMTGLLLLRTCWLLGPFRPRLRATRLGIAEAAFGGALVIALALLWHG